MYMKKGLITNNKYWIILFAVSLLIVVWLGVTEHLFVDERRIADDVEELRFSRESGFYDKEFELSISSPGAKIYYTLDCSRPTVNSTEYTQPIHISDASNNENVYSMREDVSAGFCSEELIAKYSEEEESGYKAPDYKIDKCTVVRAVAVYPDGRTSDIKTASYFVGFEGKPGYKDFNFVSLVLEPDDLFDYDDGIYVLGRHFDEFLQSDTIKQNTPLYWYQWLANYSSEYSTEKVANAQFFDKNGKLLLSQKCGVDIHGGGSRGYNPKAFNLTVREEIDGNETFCEDLTGDGLYTSKYVLFTGGNDPYTKAKDLICNELTRDLSYATTRFVPYVLFLDGEYWGVYFLNDKVEKDYLKYFYGVKGSNLLMMKDYKVTIGEEEDRQIWLDDMMSVPDDLSGQKEYNKVASQFDIDSTIDYFASMCFIGRGRDWPNANVGMWRTKKVKSDAYSDGRWRFVFYDVNSASISENYIEYDSIGHAMEDYPMFASLMTNAGFRNKFLDRVLSLGENEYSRENVEREIEYAKNLLAEPMKYNNMRFFGGEPKDHAFMDEMAKIEEFFEARRVYVKEMVETYR